MFYIDKLTGEVCLSRGDNAIFTLHINQGSNLNPLQYKLKEGDNIYFAIEEPNQPFENAIVKKVINLKNNLLDKNGNITFEMTPDDTVLLMPGLYYYEIKAKLSDISFENNSSYYTYEFISQSIQYLPPEFLLNNTYQKESDIYSFGIVLYEWLLWKQCYSKDEFPFPWSIIEFIKNWRVIY